MASKTGRPSSPQNSAEGPVSASDNAAQRVAPTDIEIGEVNWLISFIGAFEVSREEREGFEIHPVSLGICH